MRPVAFIGGAGIAAGENGNCLSLPQPTAEPGALCLKLVLGGFSQVGSNGLFIASLAAVAFFACHEGGNALAFPFVALVRRTAISSLLCCEHASANSSELLLRAQICIRMRGYAERSFVGSAGVAQSVEQLIRNEKVGCSIHLSGTNKDKGSSLSK